MSSTNDRRGIRVLTFNIAKHYMHLDVVLETLKDDFDVLFIQEPPWQTIRRAPSAYNKEGAEVIGAPRHPHWIQAKYAEGHVWNQCAKPSTQSSSV